MTTGQWLRPPEVDPEATVRLFLFHYAGGGIGMYSRWPTLLPSSIACQRVHLPGRHERHREPLLTSLEPLLEQLVEIFESEPDERPYVLFGHSMGALLAYRLGVALRAAGLAGPSLVAAAAWSPTGLPIASDSARAAVTAELAFTDALQADIAVVTGYRDDGAKLDCPVVAYAGSDDPLVPAGAMRAWAERTPAYLGCREFPGGHFFIREQGEAVAADLVQVIQQRMP
ncbi:thioesterase II family protein [Allorhizocola rhizosphaerae]|uniref:thioesterase II family protein n=1 Tax=Allorhizocola rhizosphaerae TaxID=1872709 RepID=UPI000E3E5B86|nr:alpha/beta fold hydrolase [Allorhizocola rhizosphaerae]